MPEKKQNFRGVSLKRELVSAIEQFIKEHPEYKNISDFVHQAVREKMEGIKISDKDLESLRELLKLMKEGKVKIER